LKLAILKRSISISNKKLNNRKGRKGVTLRTQRKALRSSGHPEKRQALVTLRSLR